MHGDIKLLWMVFSFDDTRLYLNEVCSGPLSDFMQRQSISFNNQIGRVQTPIDICLSEHFLNRSILKHQLIPCLANLSI